MEANVDAVIEEALAKKESGDYTVQTDDLDDAVQVEVKALAAKWDVEPKNGSIASYDKSTGKFYICRSPDRKEDRSGKTCLRYHGGDESGRVRQDDHGDGERGTAGDHGSSGPRQFQKIGTYTTTTTTNKDRNENIRLACAAINGTILQPGEEFSFNKMTGNRTTEKEIQTSGCVLQRRCGSGSRAAVSARYPQLSTMRSYLPDSRRRNAMHTHMNLPMSHRARMRW